MCEIATYLQSEVERTRTIALRIGVDQELEAAADQAVEDLENHDCGCNRIQSVSLEVRIMNEIKVLYQRQVAKTYVECIEDGVLDFSVINKAIAERWSELGLKHLLNKVKRIREV